MKKRISLLMAIIMIFSLFAPFALPGTAVTVFAIDDDLDNRYAAVGGRLLASSSGFLYRRAQPAPGLRHGRPGVDAPSENVLLNWRIDHIPGNVNDGMYLLRFFDSNGRRHELTARQILSEDGEVGLLVNYDIYVRRYEREYDPVTSVLINSDFVGYRHIGDPMFPPGGAGAFHIFVPAINGFESAATFFANPARQDTDDPNIDGSILDRVNNRQRFVTPAAISPSWGNATERVTFFHPDLHDLPNDVIPTTDAAFYQRLSPSFNISHGMGYSFRFGGLYFHFLWQDNQFYFYAENIIQDGEIQEFTLERYATAAANTYLSGAPAFSHTARDASPLPTVFRPVIENPIPPADRVVGHVFVMPSIDRDSMNFIPFAQNRVGDTLVPHTNPAYINRENDALHGDAVLSGMPVPATGGPFYPDFNVEPLDMRTPDSNIYPVFPAEQPHAGLDMRFNLPTLFDEEAGRFSAPLTDNTHLHNSLVMSLIMDIDGGGRNTTEDFTIQFPIRYLEEYGVNPYDYAGITGSFISASDNMRLRDISLLRRVDQPDNPDRVRIKVSNMHASLAYEHAFLSFLVRPVAGVPAPTNILVDASPRIAGINDPIYTFLRYTFIQEVGRTFIRVEPFNHRFGFVREGWYTLRGGEPIPGSVPQRVEFGVTTHLFFPVPRVPAGLTYPPPFWIAHTQQNPIAQLGQIERLSQEVYWAPDGEPVISLPNNFNIRNVLNRPVQGDPHAGALTYTASWDIGTMDDVYSIVMDMMEATPSRYLELSYMMWHNVTPETYLTHDGHREYLRVDMQIRIHPNPRMIPGPVPGILVTEAALQVRYAGSFPSHNWNLFADPIVNNGRVSQAITYPVLTPVLGEPGWCDDGWLDLGFRYDPSIGDQVFFASIDIATDSIRRYRAVPPPPTMRRDFTFPSLYFLNIQLYDWNLGGEPSTAFSLFDYIIVDDVSELAPPPPTNLRVSASTDPTAPPELMVGFAFPSDAIRTYLQSLYEMEVQLWVNLYIGQFEEAIMDTFFHGPLEPAGTRAVGQPLYPQARPNVSVNVPFADVYTFNQTTRRMELDLTAYQSILRGEGNTPAAVVRITDIPLIVTTSPPALIGDVINYESFRANYPAQGSTIPETPDLRNAFNETTGIIDSRANHDMVFHIVGVEENIAYFLFSDLSIQKFIQYGDTPGTWAVRPESPATSALSGIVTDTTVGTPQEPGPGEVAPPAPENIGVRDIEQMAATVFWDYKMLTPEEIRDGVQIEWEIIRIQNVTRFSREQMNDRSNPDFAAVFASLGNSPLRKGWVTSGNSLTVHTVTTTTVIDAPNDGTEYEWFPRFINEDNGNIEVVLRDKTLHPNNLYFYYVRTVRIEQVWDDQLWDYVMIRNVSVWVEATVTTYPIQPPHDLRQEDPGDRAGFCGQTMALVSWAHSQMGVILEGMGDLFLFQYQIRQGDGEWREVVTIPPELMVEYNLDPRDPLRIHYLLTGLEPGEIYQMRVRLYDVTAGDESLWSNVITIMTEMDQQDERLQREADDWLRYLRRRLEELLRQPFWTAQRTETSHIMVYRPADVFEGLILSTYDTPISLHNSGEDTAIYYIPINAVQRAFEERHGFETSFPDMQFLFAPSFINYAINRPWMNMLRALDARGTPLSDAFVRISFTRTPLNYINNVPALTPATTLQMELVGTNRNIRNIRSWDATMLNTATNIVENWLTDAVVREGIIEQLRDELSNEEISDHIYHLVARVEAEIAREVGRAMSTAENYGILATEHRYTIEEFDAPVHVTALNVTDNMSVNGYREVNNAWQQQRLMEVHNGRSFITRAPGTFAFAGREVIIPEIEVTPRGPVVTSIVARYGLEDLFGVNVDLLQFANRGMIVGSIARMAGAPPNANAMNWAVANLNVTMSARNATGLMQKQEAVALVMALYELRTGRAVNTLRVGNFAVVNGMDLDTRYATAVRAAFELRLVSPEDFDPRGPVTIGEFLDMLSIMSARIRV